MVRSVPLRDTLGATTPDDRHAHDAVLAERMGRDDADAFRQLFERHHAGLIRFATMLGMARDVADDIVEDVFVRIWERRRVWSLTGTVESYLFGAVRNRALNARRDAGRLAAWGETWTRDAQSPGMSESVPDIEEAVATADGMARVWAAIMELPPRCRAVMVLRWQQQMTMAEISRVMGISLAAVEQQHSRGVRALRARLADLLR